MRIDINGHDMGIDLKIIMPLNFYCNRSYDRSFRVWKPKKWQINTEILLICLYEVFKK